jgi:hypothetical protein
MNITVVEDPEDTRENCDLSSNEEVVESDRRDLLLLEEDTRVLDIEHLDGLEDGEVEDAIWPDNVGLLIVPLHLESVLLLSQSCHSCNLILNL